MHDPADPRRSSIRTALPAPSGRCRRTLGHPARSACAFALALVAACRTATEPPRFLDAPGALGPYSGSVAAGGLVFASGKVGSDRSSFAAECESALLAVETELARHGLGTADVVSVTVHLGDIGDYAAFNDVYRRHFHAPFPARTCVAVAGLPAGAHVEITCTAVAR